ncbi:DUF3131 domain-containing protein [Salibaculum griseiflavum]|uniref:DUF3131 domain-containing protein n=1 Tax=Salibaculum griseiflavum TaxID=1914409 RepID=A0A2V1P5E4_9RHOB|nr:DUF3131 domain-containing protein [Salibaculum griseiflavum]PWG16442.1 hypothetical protein DFK10_11655 [Salibaculum griseiflavum]
MEVTRRQYLASVSALALALSGRRVAGQSLGAGSLFLVIQGVEKTPNSDFPARILRSFSNRLIPLTVVFSEYRGDENSSRQTDRLKALLVTLGADKGIVELAVNHVPIDSAHRYLHLREATRLRDRIADLLGDTAFALDDAVSVFLPDGAPGIEPFAYRAAGFRIQIDAGQTDNAPDRTEVQPVDWGILRLSGGIRRRLNDDPAKTIPDLGLTAQPQMLVLDISDVDPSRAIDWAEAWAKSLDLAFGNGRIVPTRPKDHLLQGNPGASKNMALAFETDRGSEVQADFAMMLDEIEVPYSLIGADPDTPPSSSTGTCLTTATRLARFSEPGSACFRSDDPIDQLSEDNIAEIVLSPRQAGYAEIGPRADGRFHIGHDSPSLIPVGDRIRENPMTDALAIISPDEIATRFQRIQLQRTIQTAKREGLVTFTTIEGLRDALAAPDQVLRRFWSARRREARGADEPSPPNAAARTAFLEDARQAYSFIDRFTRADTGLCAGTAQSGAATLVINAEITLWDVASQVQGLMAAAHLSLIPHEEARVRIEKILRAIPTIELDGHRLPPALFDAGTLEPTRMAFDACDTGRFLIALQRAEKDGFATPEQARKLIDGWDLARAIRGGHPFNGTSTGWVDTQQSHCTHYIRRGFAFAGLSVHTPYPTLSDRPSGDDRIRLLYAAADLGHFGPEPALLEAIEFGQSPEARYLADVLFDAQLRLFEETGRYRCVSEVPLNRPPWFAYQGLRVDLPGDTAWIIAATGPGQEAGSDPALEDRRMISTKAIYLWAATRSHDFIDDLLALARSRARLDSWGFASGLQEDDLTPMEGYSDLNTNGIILTAIQHILSRRA